MPSASQKAQLAPLRALIPSWRFFDDAGPALTLRIRCGSEAEPGPWHDAMPSAPRRWYSLFFSPEANARLALLSLVERAVDEDDNGVALELVERACRAALPPGSGTHFQFEIRDLAGDETYVLSVWLAR